MRSALFVACILLMLCSAGQLQAQAGGAPAQDSNKGHLHEDVELCFSSKDADPERRINACTAAIQSRQFSGAELAKLYIGRGAALFLNHQTDAAIADYSQAIRVDPSNAAGFFNRASCYIDKGDFDPALQDLNEALRLSPRNYYVLRRRAWVYKARKDFDRALRDLNENVEAHPESGAPWGDRAEFFAAREEYDRAIQDYSTAIHLSPTVAAYFHHRGDAYSGKGDYAHALEDYVQAGKDSFYETFDLEKRGQARFFLGQYAAAEKEFARALNSLPPDTIRALWHYLAQARAGGPAAEKELRTSAPQSDDVRWRRRLVDLYLGQVTPEEVLSGSGSMETWERLETLFYLGEYALLHHKKAQAAQWFRECISLWPADFVEAEYWGAKAELTKLTSEAK